MTDSVWDYILFRARCRPQSLAVFGPGGAISYRRLVTDAAGLATELLDRGVTRADMVGIQMESSYLHLLLILALDRLDVPSTVVTVARVDVAALAEQRALTLIISAEPEPPGIQCRWMRMEDEDHPKIATPDRTRLQKIVREPEALVRVNWSSGTTGGVKGSAITRSRQMMCLALYQMLLSYSAATRYLLAIGFGTSYGYGKALAVLTAGGAVVFLCPGVETGLLAKTVGVTTIGTNVLTLRELLERQGASLHGLERLRLEVTGSHLPAKLARAARSLLTADIRTVYGATESTTVAVADVSVTIADPSAVGFLVPSIVAEIVDQHDQLLSSGQEGRLRVRGAQVIRGYYRNDAATRRNFRDGWFYPGDVGSISSEGLLRITGRLGDVARGDMALAPVPLESVITALPGVRDAAVFPIATSDGSSEVCVALVLDPGFAPESTLAQAKARLGDRAPVQAIVVESLPRNANGKVLKRDLGKLAKPAAVK